MEINFTNKEIFLTGGSRGIGKKIKEMFEKNGAKVISPDIDELDLSQPECIEKYLNENPNLEPDVFIHCAGINKLSGIEQIKMEEMEEIFHVNCFAPVQLLSKIVSLMKRKPDGHIIFISSLYALIGKERRIAYSSSKAALTGLTKTLALELAPFNIMVNAVAPGYVMTEMTRKNLSDAEQKEIKSAIPTGRFQTEEEIAELVLFLSSNLNASITGQIIAVDGGFTAK